MNSIERHVDSSADLTVFVVEGEVLAEDVRSAIRDFYNGNVTKNVLWDLSKSDLSQVSAAEVRSLAGTPRTHCEARMGGKTALVASEDVVFGLSRMFEMKTELKDLPFETMTFRSVEEAMKWIISDANRRCRPETSSSRRLIDPDFHR